MKYGLQTVMKCLKGRGRQLKSHLDRDQAWGRAHRPGIEGEIAEHDQASSDMRRRLDPERPWALSPDPPPMTSSPVRVPTGHLIFRNCHLSSVHGTYSYRSKEPW